MTSGKIKQKFKKNTFILNRKNPQILYIHGGFAHGSQNLNSNTNLSFFQISILNKVKGNGFESDYWEVGILNIVKIKYEKYSVPKKMTQSNMLKKLNGAFGKLGCVIGSLTFIRCCYWGWSRRAILRISINQ